VRVPDEAASTSAKVILTFPDWEEGKVIPALFEIPIADGPAESKK
jgi:hypothetical protein